MALKKESKYFKKIFYSYLAIFTILTVIVEILVCGSIVSGNRAKAIKLETFFEENFNTMENKIISIFQVTNMLSESEEVKAFSTIPYKEYRGRDFYSLFNLNKTMSNYMASYLGVECRISLFKPDDEIVFDSRHGYVIKGMDAFFSTKKIQIDKVLAALDESADNVTNTALFLNDSDDNGLVSFLTWHRYPDDRYIFYFIEFDKNYFFPVSGVNQDEFFAVLDRKTGDVCVNQTSVNRKENKTLSKVPSLELPTHTKTVFENGIYAKNSQMISGLVYLYHNPGVYSVGGYVMITVLLFLLWIILMVAGAYVSRYLARRLYGPVHNVFGILGDAYHQEHDDDMLFLSDSITDLVNNNKRLQELAEKNKIYLKHNFIKDILVGSLAQSQVKANLDEYNLEYFEKECLCIICEYETVAGDKTVMDYQKNLTLRSLFMSAAEEKLRVNVSCELVNIDRNRFAIIMAKVNEIILSRLLLNLVNEAENNYNFSLIMGVGKTVDSIYEIEDSYMSALNLLEYRFAMDDKRIIRLGDLEQMDKTNYYYPVEVEKNLIYNVLEGNLEKCEDILSNIFHVNFAELSLDKFNIKDFKFAITATVKRILKQINETPEEIFGKDVIIYLELNGASEVAEIEQSVRRIVSEIVRYIQENSKNKKRVITQNIIQYIDENYQSDISLSDVAAHFCLSEGHIGRLLKNDLNISFKQYLNERRIEVAKQLLLSDENHSVGEVAVMVGCNSAMTFIRMFKKHTGISPGEFKKSQNA